MKKILFSTLIAVLTLMGATAQTADKTIVITSDWHLSDARSFEQGCYYAWCDKNKELLVNYLAQLTKTKDQWDVLVLNGDIFEFWRSPVYKYMVADSSDNVLTDAQYLLKIKECNAEIFAALEQLHADGKEIVYLPGNHDLTVSQEDIEAAFPGLFTCAYDTKGTGIYEPFGKNTAVAIEHGNRYEYFNAPYQHGVFGSDYADSTSLLAPGYFTSKLGATATVYKASLSKAKAKYKSNVLNTTAEETDADNRTFLSTFWNAIHAGNGSPIFDIKTRIDGIGSEEHSVSPWSEYAVSETNSPALFKESWTVANWKKRCELNNVPVYIPLTTSLLSAGFHDILDDLAFTERLCNKNLPTLICVFGHSHVKTLQTRQDEEKGDVVYLNEGAWVDNASMCTYGVIHYKADQQRYDVELRKFDENGNDAMLDCRYLYVPSNNASKQTDGTWKFNAKASLVTPLTGIDNVNTDVNANYLKGCYNLNGQRLTAPIKGINIINGKKMIKK